MSDHAPYTLSQLQELVRHLHAEAVPWLPSGQGSRLPWGPPVAAGSQVVSGRRLHGILEHNPGDFTVTVAAGTPLVEVQQHLAQHRQWLSLDPPWGTGLAERDPSGPDRQGGGSIGGLVARGLSGGYRQRYMGLRDQLIGIQLLRSDGVLARAGGKVVKNVAGYDLMRLLAGSWGSLGLITSLTLRTHPLPPQRRALLIQAPLAELAPLVRWLLSSSLAPERIDWWSAPLAAAAGHRPEPLLLLSLASISAETLLEQINCIEAKTPHHCLSLEPEALEPLLAAGRGCGTEPAPEPPAWLLRLAVPPASLAELLACPAAQGLAMALAAGSGIGDAWASAADLPRYRVEELRRQCSALGGYLTVLHQPEPSPGVARLNAWLDAPARPWIEAVKRHFDPSQQLARGRLPGVAG